MQQHNLQLQIEQAALKKEQAALRKKLAKQERKGKGFAANNIRIGGGFNAFKRKG